MPANHDAGPRPSWRDRLLVQWWTRRWRGFLTLRALLPRGPWGEFLLYETRYGGCFLLDPLSHIDNHVITEGYYESEVLEALRERLSPDDVLWDIGANFGLHAVTVARLLPGATVVAFEPNPIEHARLLRHRDWNTPHLLTCSLALSETTGIQELHLGPAGNSGMTSLIPRTRGTSTGTVLVGTATGDDLIARKLLPAPTVIKLDVEGHELAVLRGLAGALAAPGCRLVVFEDEPGADTPLKQLLRTAGFTVALLTRREPTAHPLANFAARRTASPGTTERF